MDAREPSEELYTLARDWWRYSDASISDDPAQKARTNEGGDLEGIYDECCEVIEDPARAEDFLVALVDTRRNDDRDLNFLGAGFVEDVWHDGDHDILDKLRHRGVPAEIVAKLDANLWR